MQKRTIFLALTLLVSFLCLPFISYAGGYIELPRKLGDLSMGMSAQKFTSLTKITPQSCAICITKETFATLNQNQLDAFDVDANGADVFFYDNKLYLISLGTFNKDLFTVNEQFESELGGPGKKIGNFNEVTKLQWEDPYTIISINYSTKEKTVFSINYIDWELKQDRDWHESQTKITAKKTPIKSIDTLKILQ